MNAPVSRSANAERLRASPNFALTFTFDGRPYIAKDSEPYIQYWLNERYRILLSMFSSKRGVTSAEAVEGYFRLTRTARTKPERQRLLRAIEDMRSSSVLIGANDDVSRYDKRIVQDYLTHRPFPGEISDFIIQSAPIAKASRVLDLAGGPGDLAVRLAHASDHVTLMELSRGFVNAARARAKKLGLNLSALQDSCNRLVYGDDSYDVITVAQALHWLDDVMVCRGICRILQPGGSFFVVHAAMTVEESHPLSHLFGHKSVLGEKPSRPFVDEVGSLLRRLSLLFEALDSPDVDRIDVATQSSVARGSHARIAPARTALFRQRRPMGVGYARAFLTPTHIEVTGMSPDAFWKDVEARCAAATSENIIGTVEWAVLRFQRGKARSETPPLEACAFVEIGYDGPSAG